MLRFSRRVSTVASRSSVQTSWIGVSTSPSVRAFARIRSGLCARCTNGPMLKARGLSEHRRMELVFCSHCIGCHLRPAEFGVVFDHLQCVCLRTLGSRRPEVRKKVI